MLRLSSVTKSWHGFQLKNINLHIKSQEYFVILGPTGAGKTLLLELIAGFHHPNKGSIYIDSKRVDGLPPEKRGIGFVYQDYMLFPHMNVFENIAYGIKVKMKRKSYAVNHEVYTIAHTLGIQHLLERNVKSLSGGEQQRVALARALVVKPQILLLDEPLSAVDPQLQQKLRDELKIIHNKFKLTTIHVTHNREEAMVMADRIAILHDGKILQVGTPETIFRKPKTEFIANFVGVENIYAGTSEIIEGVSKITLENGVQFISTNLLAGNVNIAIRPEDIIVSKRKVMTSARNCLYGKVKEISDRGATIRLIVDVYGSSSTSRKPLRALPVIVLITHQSYLDLDLKIGTDVYLYCKAGAVHMFR